MKRDDENEGIPVVGPAAQVHSQATKGARTTDGAVSRNSNASNRNRCNESRLLRRLLPPLHRQACLLQHITHHPLPKMEATYLCRLHLHPLYHPAIPMEQGVSHPLAHSPEPKPAGTTQATVDEDGLRELEHVKTDNSTVWNSPDETTYSAIEAMTSLLPLYSHFDDFMPYNVLLSTLSV